MTLPQMLPNNKMSAFSSSMSFPNLINVLIILMCNFRKIIPWDNIKMNFHSFFVDCASIQISTSGLFGFIIIGSTSAFVLYQYYSMYHQAMDYEVLCQSSEQIYEKVFGVTEYFQETDNFFKKIECKSREVQRRYKNFVTLNNTTSLFNKLQDDISHTKSCWEKEIRAFNCFGIDVNGYLMAEPNISAQLTMAKGLVERESRKIEKNIAEDRLSFDKVKRDIRKLQKYFDRVEL